MARYGGTTPINYLFIDGGCVHSTLDYCSKAFFGGETLTLDFQTLTPGYSKVFYYDSLPAQKPEESDDDYERRIQPTIAFFNGLRELGRFHVYEGTTRRRRKVVEQKQVDIMIAVHMLTHAHRRNMERATLLTGDLDFKPLLDALVQEGMFVTLWYPRGRTNQELIYAADARMPFNLGTIHSNIGATQRTRYPLPSGAMTPMDADPSWHLIRSWNCPKHGQVRLYQDQPGRFTVVVADLLNRGMWEQIISPSMDVLRFYLTDSRDITWQD